MKIAHLTSAHPRDDARIFFKECLSLAKHYDVCLVVADGLGDEERQGVAIHDVGKASGRYERMRKTPQRVLERALALNADLYHLHDPELLTIARRLKKMGKKVIFDAHEDLPKQIHAKHYLPPYLRHLVSKLTAFYEKWVCRRLDGVVAATESIRDKFVSYGAMTESINNYPLLSERITPDTQDTTVRDRICYVGGIAAIRGAREMIAALAHLPQDVRLLLAGQFETEALHEELAKNPQWERVDFQGWLTRNEVQNVYARSFAGLVALYPMQNYLDALPVKMFEYMSAGVPVIASNFPLWKSIIEENQCGICVDPFNVEEMAQAIHHLYQHPDLVQEMGRNGQRAINEIYNWSIQEKKLVEFYRAVLVRA